MLPCRTSWSHSQMGRSLHLPHCPLLHHHHHLHCYHLHCLKMTLQPDLQTHEALLSKSAVKQDSQHTLTAPCNAPRALYYHGDICIRQFACQKSVQGLNVIHSGLAGQAVTDAVSFHVLENNILHGRHAHTENLHTLLSAMICKDAPSSFFLERLIFLVKILRSAS